MATALSSSFAVIIAVFVAAGSQLSIMQDNILIPIASAAVPNWNFAASGDWGCTSNTINTVNNIVNKNPELVLGLGDNSYQSTADCWFNIIKPIDSRMKIAIGNHDDETTTLLNQYVNHFGLSKQYYSFNYRNIHFLVVSTEISAKVGSEQYNFVKNDLANAAANPNVKWIVVFEHKHLYTSPTLHPAYEAVRNALHPLFDKYGVDLVLTGHSHNYQRTYPLKFNSANSSEPVVTDNDANTYNNPHNPIFIITGLGGASYVHGFTGSQAYFVAHQFDDHNYGFLDINVTNDGQTLQGKFYANNKDNNGNSVVMDSFTINKTLHKNTASYSNNADKYPYSRVFVANGSSSYNTVSSNEYLQPINNLTWKAVPYQAYGSFRA